LQNWFGFLLIIFSFAIPLVARNYIGKRYARFLMFFVFLHNILSIINAFFYTFSSLSKDAIEFNRKATEWGWGHHGVLTWPSSNIYPYILSFFYKLGPSILIGQELSIIAYAISGIVLYAYIRKFHFRKYAVPILVIFSINPICLINTSGVLREAWEILFLMSCCFYAIKVANREKYLLKNVLLMLLFGVLVGWLHAGLSISALFIIGVTICFAFFMSKSIKLSNSISILIFILISIAGILLFFYFYTTYQQIFFKIINYAGHLPEANTTYRIDFMSSPLTGIVESFFYYMFYPFPWHVFSFNDLIACLLGIFRLLLIIFSLKLFVLYEKEFKKTRLMKLVFIYVIFVAFVFSVGTDNYGTGLRHQTLTYWGLVLFGVPGFMEWMKSYLRRYALTK